MFSSLASIADRNFIVGFFLPTVIGFLSLLALFADWPQAHSLWLAVANAEKLPTLTLVVVGLWGSALTLQLLNLKLYRILEGYVFPFNAPWCGLRLQQLAQWRATHAETVRLGKKAAETKLPGDAMAYGTSLYDFLRRFPKNHRNILPTAFGNVLRAFETYSNGVYNVDAIPAWPRLAAVIPDSYAGLLDRARAEVDFFVNLCFFGAAVAVVALLRALFLGAAMVFFGATWTFVPLVCLTAAMVAAFAAYAAYQGALHRALSWGNVVRSAFDLYLPALAKQLGYELPATLTARNVFWDRMTKQWLYHKVADPDLWKTRPCPDVRQAD